MSVLSALVTATRSGSVEVVDLTTPLQESTPILELPAPFANTSRFRLEELSRYDDRGPAWYWNDIHTGEHTGTHLDAPNHWVTGRDGVDVSQAPMGLLVAPVVVIDMSREVEGDPDFLLEVAHIEAWQAEHGPLPDGGWLLLPHRVGVPRRDAGRVHERRRGRPAHPGGVRRVRALDRRRSRRWPGSASRPSAPTPVPRAASTRRSRATTSSWARDKWGLTSLRNLGRLPPTGAVLVVCPLPIVGGSGSPTRVLALVET